MVCGLTPFMSTDRPWLLDGALHNIHDPTQLDSHQVGGPFLFLDCLSAAASSCIDTYPLSQVQVGKGIHCMYDGACHRILRDRYHGVKESEQDGRLGRALEPTELGEGQPLLVIIYYYFCISLILYVVFFPLCIWPFHWAADDDIYLLYDSTRIWLVMLRIPHHRHEQ